MPRILAKESAVTMPAPACRLGDNRSSLTPVTSQSAVAASHRPRRKSSRGSGDRATFGNATGICATAEIWLMSRPASDGRIRSEEHTSELQSLMRISYAVFCLKKKNNYYKIHEHN